MATIWGGGAVYALGYKCFIHINSFHPHNNAMTLVTMTIIPILQMENLRNSG